MRCNQQMPRSRAPSLFSILTIPTAIVWALVLNCATEMSSATLHASFEAVAPALVKIKNLPKTPMLKVLLNQDQETGLMIEAIGSHNIYDPYTGKKLEGAFRSSSYYMSATSEGIKWGQEFPGIFQILIIPDTQKMSSIVVNGIQYSGVVAFYQIENKIAAVNWLSLEDFTNSLMSSTFLPTDTDEKEALAAYAIAIRTVAYQALLHSTNRFWDIKAADAVYRGMAVHRLDKPFTEALKISQDIVLTSPSEYKKSHTGQTIAQDVQQIMQSMPMQNLQKMAQHEGKNARYILEEYYPGQILTIAQSPKIAADHPYTQ